MTSIMIKKKITEEELEAFMMLTEDYSPIHKKGVVHGAYLASILLSLFSRKKKYFILHGFDIRFVRPAYVGDVLKFTAKHYPNKNWLDKVEMSIFRGEELIAQGEVKAREIKGR